MTPPDATRQLRRTQSFQHLLEEKGWYHSFQFADGTAIDGIISVHELQKRWARFPLPADLTSKRVLDIGAWDGWFSFEAERRGAEVVAVDCIEVEHFQWVHQKVGSRVDYRILDFYEIPYAGLGQFDYVFFLGILYHLRHPLLALEMVCAMARDLVVVESFVTDGLTWEQHRGAIPTMEFYETDELGGLLDNWIGPSVLCLEALCRAAGFARVANLHVHDIHAGFACFRRWEAGGADAAPAPRLVGVGHARSMGIGNFSTRRSEEYITCWFECAGRAPASRFDLQLDVGGYGVPAFYYRPDGTAWMASFRLPPGLAQGWTDVRLRLEGTAWSEPHRIAVDVPEQRGALELKAVQDGVDWAVNRVKREHSHATLWVRGLGENADRGNVRAFAGDRRLAVEYVGTPDPDGYRQVNARVPAAFTPGETEFAVEYGGTRSQGLAVVLE